MTAGASVAAAAIFFWLGMVMAISFLEAPLKFRAPGVTLPFGLGIGRMVFRALNTVEAITAALVIVALISHRSGGPVLAGAAGAAVPARSRAHYGYLVLEVVKVSGLIVGGIGLLAG